MAQNKQWTFTDIARAVAANTKEVRTVAKELDRSVGAVRQVRAMATMYKNGRGQYMSEHMQTQLRQYFTNAGDMQLKEHPADGAPTKQPAPEQAPVTTDTCAAQMNTLINETEQLFEQIQEKVAQLAKLQAAHQTHTVVKELEEVKEQYKKMEKEVLELREFKQTAEKRGFGQMLRGTRPF